MTLVPVATLERPHPLHHYNTRIRIPASEHPHPLRHHHVLHHHNTHIRCITMTPVSVSSPSHAQLLHWNPHDFHNVIGATFFRSIFTITITGTVYIGTPFHLQRKEPRAIAHDCKSISSPLTSISPQSLPPFHSPSSSLSTTSCLTPISSLSRLAWPTSLLVMGLDTVYCAICGAPMLEYHR